MLIAMIGFDAMGKQDTRLEYRDQHRARIKQLHEQGRIHSVGPMMDQEDSEQVVGSLIVAEFNTLAEAQQWIAEDPYTVNELYQSMTIQPYNKLLP